MSGASSAATTMMAVTTAAAIVTFERRNEYMMSLSSIARSHYGFSGGMGPPGSTLTSRHLRINADARIDHRVEQIDDQVDGHEDESDQQQIRRHDRDIDVLHRLQKQGPRAGPLQRALGDRREGDDRAELQ